MLCIFAAAICFAYARAPAGSFPATAPSIVGPTIGCLESWQWCGPLRDHGDRRRCGAALAEHYKVVATSAGATTSPATGPDAAQKKQRWSSKVRILEGA
jgi:hypothetical protein